VELLPGRSVKVGTKVLPRRLKWFNQNLKLMMYCVGEVDGGVGKADDKETAEDKEGPPEMIEMETNKGKVIDDDDVKAVEKATTAVDAPTEDKVTEGTNGKYLNGMGNARRR
jgi:hypothetical protein